MTEDDLLKYYERELAFFRQMGAKFSKVYPKIAGRLRLRPEASHDPHVERLIEAFAFLTARIRYKLDDDFPEIAQSLLDVVYPHLLAPIPSLAIVQFSLDPSKVEMTTGYPIRRGTNVETLLIQGDSEPCQFRTGYPVTLWPLEPPRVELLEGTGGTPASAVRKRSKSVLKIDLACFPGTTFSQLHIPKLRLFINAPMQQALPLYELIFKNTLGLSVSDGTRDGPVTPLPLTAISPVGFGLEDGLLPYPARSFLGYRLLTEFFVFPEKFLFFDIDLSRLPAAFVQSLELRMTLFLYIDRLPPQPLESPLPPETLQLGCTPMVNLFTHRAEPIAWNHLTPEMRVIADVRRQRSLEVYSVDQVIGTSPDGDELTFRPFHSFRHAGESEQTKAFWHATRRPSDLPAEWNDLGTEVFLSLVDLDFSPYRETGWTIDVQTTCLNRDVPHRLPFGGGEPRLQAAQAPVAKVTCLTQPTPTYRPGLRHAMLWRMVSHLSLNHLTLVANAVQSEKPNSIATDDSSENLTDRMNQEAASEDRVAPLRELLRLYDFADSEATRTTIDSLRDISAKPEVGRLPGGPGAGICRGLGVNLKFDPRRLPGQSAYLFASVLEHFLGLYCSINSFTKLTATLAEPSGVEKKWNWPPRAGERILV